MFPNFPFRRVPKIENWEISKGVLLLQILTVVVTKDEKTAKNQLR